jgi:hypothetical protein
MIYQIKVMLRGSQPLIWRRIQVSSDTTLAKLHRILQCMMGWEDTHLHCFMSRGTLRPTRGSAKVTRQTPMLGPRARRP